jgi:hypothetical protein
MNDYPPKLKKILEKQGKLPTKSLEERKRASLEALEEMKDVLNKEDKKYLIEILNKESGDLNVK